MNLITIEWPNHPPNKPKTPWGPEEGHTGSYYTYSTVATDPDSNYLISHWDWGDGTSSEEWGYSGETISESHRWNTPGTYKIRVKVKDPYGSDSWSPWSDTLSVKIEEEPCCFPAGTKIIMANGMYKNIEDVKVGDRVLSYNIKHDRFTSWTVKMLGKPVHPVYEINDGLIRATVDHPLYIKKSDDEMGWGAIDTERAKNAITFRGDILPLEVGDKLFTKEGEWVEVTSIKSPQDPVQTYNLLSFSGTRTYFANDILVYEEHPPHCMTDYFTRLLGEKFPRLEQLLLSRPLFNGLLRFLP